MTTNISDTFKDQRWLVAHNAWNTEIAPNQEYTVTELLNYGVRGLALDIWGDDESHLHLQHGPDNPASATKWSKVRDELKVWLENNPQEFVTLFFESYLAGPVKGKTQSALKGLEDSLKNYIPSYKPGRDVQENAMYGFLAQQPAPLTDLINNNHRLFAFIEAEPASGRQSMFPVMSVSFAENVYGDASLKIPSWVNLRDGSRYANQLTFMNHFGNAPTGSEWDRNKTALIKKHAHAFMFAFGGRYPNFVSLDYINWKQGTSGPVAALNTLRSQKDYKVTFFYWSTVNDFDDLAIDISDKTITGFTVTTARGQGITKISPERGSGPGVTAIKLVNKAGYGVVNMRYKVKNQSWQPWLTNFETLSRSGDPNLAIHEIDGDLLGICCRTQDGHGVTDFATAFR